MWYPHPSRTKGSVIKAGAAAGLLLFAAYYGGVAHADDYVRDTDFQRAASAFGQRESADGRRALEKSTNVEVKQAAKILSAEGGAATDQLAQLATEKGWPVIPADDLENVGPYSDRSFVAHQIESEQRAIGFYHEEAQNGTDTDLQTFARQMLPRLERSLTILRALRVT
jgi:putative membrane protein